MQRRQFALAVAFAAVGGTAAARNERKRAPAPAPAPVITDRLLAMQPKASTRASETHACLAVSTNVFSGPYRFSGQCRTVKQLRTGTAPNEWEVAWCVWNFTDDDHLYYFVLKPNGWEIGKRDPRYVAPGNDGQLTMATGESMKYRIGDWYTFDIRVNGNEADIYVNGVFVCHFKDTDTAPFYAGRVGLYTEDALCHWNNISAPVADGFDMEPIQPFVDGSQLTYWRIWYLGYGSGGIVAAS
jgi:hypothetical protein